MKKVFLFGLPVLAVLLLIGGFVYSQSGPESPTTPMHKPHWESFPRSGFRLGVVLSDDNGDAKGVAIEKILPDSPADKAGLKVGDILFVLMARKYKLRAMFAKCCEIWTAPKIYKSKR